MSIVVPLWNEEANVDALVSMLASSETITSGDSEAVLVDNGSSDGTGRLLDDLALRYPGWLRIIHLPANENYGGGILRGCAAASGEIVCYLPGDLQYLADDLDKVVRRIRESWAAGHRRCVVKGVRTTRMDGPNFQTVSWVYTRLAGVILGLKAKDVNGLPKAFNRELLDLIPGPKMQNFVLDAQLLLTAQRNGWLLEEVPVVFHARRAGISSWSGRRLRVYAQTFRDLWALRRHRPD